MKILYTLLLIMLLLSSCNDEALLYSCDPVLNEIITIHKAEYVQYTVKDIIVSTPEVQRAIFRSYEPSKKREIWLEKIKYLLDNENYTPEEYAHVEKIRDHLTANYFNPDSIKTETGIRTQFITDWISYAKNNLGWSEKYLAFVIYRLYTKPEQLDNEISAVRKLSQQAVADSEVATCDCKITDDYCNGSSCASFDCQQTSGCGTFWQYTCDGACQAGPW
jgi:hypothetical protein